MSSWLLLLKSSSIFSTDGDLYACTLSAWASVSKLILLLLQECWGSNPHLTEYSGLLKGYVCNEGYRYVWFDQCHYAGPSDIDVAQFSEGCTPANKNILYWFYLPQKYRQLTHLYGELKHLLLGTVPFRFTSGEELPPTLSSQPTLRTNHELYLLTNNSKDLMFYCIQSRHISVEDVVPVHGPNTIGNSMHAELPHSPFRYRSVLESCNMPASPLPFQSRAMTDDLGTYNSDEGSDDLKLASTLANIDECVDDSCVLEGIKDEPDDDCKINIMREMQKPEESPWHGNSPSLEERKRKGSHSNGAKLMSFRKLLSISKTYGELAAAKEHAERKLWGALSSRVVPTLVLQCPCCGKYFPPSSPQSLWNMLTHMRSKHKKYNSKLLPSISDVLDILIPFMQKKIAVWNRRKRKIINHSNPV